MIKIEGVDDPQAAKYAPLLAYDFTAFLTGSYRFYLGKKIAYVYRGSREIRGTKFRVIWGKVTRPHGMLKDGMALFLQVR